MTYLLSNPIDSNAMFSDPPQTFISQFFMSHIVQLISLKANQELGNHAEDVFQCTF